MSAELLYCCKMYDESEDYNLTLEFLSTLDAYVGTWENREERTVIHTVYSVDRPGILAAMEQLRQQIPQWREFGVTLTQPEYFELPKEDWSEVWKKYFHILHIADNLVIRPSWLPYTAAPGQAVVDIDPGMSFGTGQHATTAYCLRTLARFAGDPRFKNVLDAGCGSGILAIAAAKLGYERIDAFDYDPDAVMVSRENLENNGLGEKQIHLFQADASLYNAPDDGYDLAVVNILCHILKANHNRIISWIKPGRYLALAGILNAEFEELSRVFCSAGCVELDRFQEKEWTSGLFQVPQK